MSWVLFVEDQTPHQSALTERSDEVFPPQPGRAAHLDARVAQTAEEALTRLGLDGKFACINVSEVWDNLPQPLRDELGLKKAPELLYGIACDLEIRCKPWEELTREAGLNLVRLLFHWRNRHPETPFQLVVVSQFAETERERIEPFCDRVLQKLEPRERP